jgi:hypothetical protein
MVRFEDLKDEYEGLRIWHKKVDTVLNSIEITISTIKDILAFEFRMFKHKKEEWDFLKTTSMVSNELEYLEDIIREIKKRNPDETFKKEDLAYYGFNYDELMKKLDLYLTKYEKTILDRGGYIKDKDDEDFNNLLRLIKPFRKLKDLLESLE